jgi:hypothetical protein
MEFQDRSPLSGTDRQGQRAARRAPARRGPFVDGVRLDAAAAAVRPVQAAWALPTTATVVTGRRTGRSGKVHDPLAARAQAV